MGEIIATSVSELVEKGLRDYGETTIEQRAIPDFRDGLKPVHRRILYTMYIMGILPDKGLKKSAAVVGETLAKFHPHGDCLAADTLVPLLNGTRKTMFQLVQENKPQWVLAFDKETNKYVPALAHSWRVGQITDTVYDIELANGCVFTVTNNHPFLCKGIQYVKADSLKPGMEIVGGLWTNHHYSIINSNIDVKFLHQIIGNFVYNKSEREIFHHKNENTQDNTPDNIIALNREEHAKTHQDYILGLERGRKRMFENTSDMRLAIKKKNSILMAEHNKKLPLIKAVKAIKLLIDRGFELTFSNYESLREEIYNLTKLSTLFRKKFVNFFEELINIAKTNQKIMDTSQACGLTLQYHDTALEKHQSTGPTNVLNKILKAFSRVMQYAAEVGYDLENLTWDMYDTLSASFIQEKYPYVFEKLIYVNSLKLKIKFGEISPIDLLHKSIATFVVKISERKLSEPVKMYDFTVDNYRNMAICSENGKFIIVHNSSLFKTLVNLVHERYALVFGSGNWGDKYSAPAASRYIDCRLTSLAMQLFDYIDIAKYIANYSGELKEPLVLPCKIPLLLMNGTSGIAVGISADIPPHNLGELIKALIYLIKNPRAETKKLLSFIKGPDYQLGGVLESSDNDLLKMYEVGSGPLIFRCQYKFKTTKKGKKILEIFNYGPRFDQDGFIRKCEELVEKGLLEYVNNDSADGIFKLSVGYNNSTILEEKVLPLLRTTISYHFYITERQEEDVIFKPTDLKTLMLDWLDYQRSIRIDYCNYVLKNLRVELLKHSTKLLASQSIDIVADALKTKNALIYLQKQLNISATRAKYILTLQVGALMRSSIIVQKKKIASLNAQISDYKNKLNNLDIEIIKDLKSLIPFCDERKTLIRQTPPNLLCDSNLWVALSNKGIKQFADYTKIKNANAVCMVNKGYYLIDEGGTVVKWQALEEIKLYPNTFECISGDYQYLCVIDVEGNVAVVDLFKIKKKEFVALRTKSKLIYAVGFNKHDTLLFSNAKFTHTHFMTFKDIKVCRTSTRGFRLNQILQPTRVEVISEKDIILNNQKNEQILLEDFKKNILNFIKEWSIIGEYNLVIVDQIGSILNQKDAAQQFNLKFNNNSEIRKVR